MERLLLSFGHSDELYNATVVKWHVEEEDPLAFGLSLLTLQTTTKTIVVSYREQGQQVFLRKKCIDVGQCVAFNETLALVGTRDEAATPSCQIDTLPVVGTAKVERRLIMCKTVMMFTLLYLSVPLILQFLMNRWEATLRSFPSLNIILHLSLLIAMGIAYLLILGEGIVYLLQKPPEKRRVLRFREEPQSNYDAIHDQGDPYGESW